MDETHRIVETLAAVAKAGIGMKMSPDQVNNLSAFVTNLVLERDATEQRAAEAERGLAEYKEILRAVIDGECTHKAAAKWLEEHSPHEHG